MSKRSVSVAVAALVVLATCGLTAMFVSLGGNDDERSAAPVSVRTLQLAADNTAAAESMQFELHASGIFGVSASGVISGDGTTGSMQIDLGRLGNAEQRIVDGTVYLNLANLPGGTEGKWLAVPLDRLGALGDWSALRGAGETPRSSLAVLEDAAGPVEVVGDDTIAGRHATHYRANLAKGDTTVPLDVWIDDADRVVKLHATEPGSGTEITMEITAFGVPVDVQAPPPDDVTEIPGLLAASEWAI